ncbi:hypothetical protein [Streptomyces sp. NPDC056948]|uniref:hypothetical protein n=1 Tax=Streptomyces sp. NPDC056948 TaxID=3345975 RepID=UPI003630A665
MVHVPCGEHLAQFRMVLRVRREIQLVEEGQCGGWLQVAVDVVGARPKATEEG